MDERSGERPATGGGAGEDGARAGGGERGEGGAERGEGGAEGLVRFGVSIDRALLERFDELRGRLGYETRSEALRDLIRDRLTQDDWQRGEAWVCGAVTVVYSHDRHGASRALTDLGHDSGDLVVTTLHVHLDADWCMEVLVLRGPASRVRGLAEQVGAMKGLVHGHVSLVALDGRGDAGAPDPHGHAHGP